MNTENMRKAGMMDEHERVKFNENEKAIYDSFMAAIKQTTNLTVILNGGALLALISIIAQKGAIDASLFLEALKTPVFIFVLGVFSGFLSAFVTYLSQFSYYKEIIGQDEPFKFSGTTWRKILAGTLFLSISCFGVACILCVLNVSSIKIG